jgi:uncharacterized circularly permuted ATP-grasp superfamily protein/uncharacterized alpha-E superfamily protein
LYLDPFGRDEEFPGVSGPSLDSSLSVSRSRTRRRHEIWQARDQPRPEYEPLLQRLAGLRSSGLRTAAEQLEAALREMGVAFDRARETQWVCDAMPHVFSPREWDCVQRGIQQRICAFELFLQDVYGRRRILREGVIPIQPVLGSPHYQSATVNLPRARGAYLHLCGICLARNQHGELAVRHHHFHRASGLAYMMQNRRALVRVLPDLFRDSSVHSLAETPLSIIEEIRESVREIAPEPSVVLLSPGPGSAVYAEHSFLARRMGVPLVQGGDLVVLDDCVYLKTIRGLSRVDAIYNRVADAWLDPLVLRRDSLIGVPGLVHALRRGKVTIINGLGSQLADDRTLLCFAPKIIRFYLGEDPILPTIPTFWLGDIDQRELVLEDVEAYDICPIFGEDLSALSERSLSADPAILRKEASRFIAQPREVGGMTTTISDGRKIEGVLDHLAFALRTGSGFHVFPGALTRVFPPDQKEVMWISKDTWVLGDESVPAGPHIHTRRSSAAPVREVTSRVADAFYWMGRYLERAYHQAYLIQVIETLETEELNSAERKLYRPMWNRLLPPLEKSAGESRRSITTRRDRYRLVLLPEPGSVLSTYNRALRNAESILETLSPEAWAILSNLRARLTRTRHNDKLSDGECARVARRLSDLVTRTVPQFFGTAGMTMLADDGWRFCEVGQVLERAVITANSVLSISKPLTQQNYAVDIELSAVLRLLGSRDAYRRVYQIRAEPLPVLEFLWQNANAPRSVMRCLEQCRMLLRDSAPADTLGAAKSLNAIDALIHRIRRVDWERFIPGQAGSGSAPQELEPLLITLLRATSDIHQTISDGFLSHQAYIAEASQPHLQGL